MIRKRTYQLTAILVAGFVLTEPATAATLHVPADHPTIQSCIDAAVSGQDECVVAPGTYNELINFLGKAITLRSSHGPAVTTIDGTGLNGSVVQINNHEGEQTIFDGFTVTGGKGTLVSGYVKGGGMYILNASPVVRNSIFSMNEAELGGGIWNSGRPTISHCTFLNNFGGYGGGVYHGQESQSLISDCRFQENQASERGGGLYTQSSTHTVERCQFIRNTASVGGGMRNSYSTVKIIDCDFIENTAALTGGGIANGDPGFSSELFLEPDAALRLTFDIYEIKGGTFESNKSLGMAPNQGGGAIFDSGRSTLISNATFESNSAHRGGAVLNKWNTTVIRHCRFEANEAEESGGAVYGIDKVNDCSFNNNHAGVDGGGVFHRGSLIRCFFKGNSSQRGGGAFGSTNVQQTIFLTNRAVLSGGALSGGGAWITASYFGANHAGQAGGGSYTDGPARALNSVFHDNSASYGGGLYNGNSLSLYNCTLTRNYASESGGGVSNIGGEVSGSSLSVVNSVLWGSEALISGPQLWGGEKFSGINARFSNVQDSGGSANWDTTIGNDGGANIDLNPAFVRTPDDGGDGWGDDPTTPDVDEGANDDYGDLRLQSDSPCLNVGDPAFASQPGDTDLDGHARVLCGQVDMGAYESGIGDYDCDQTVDLADFGGWEECQTGPVDPPLSPLIKGGGSGCEAFDFDGDGDVDLADFAQFELILQP